MAHVLNKGHRFASPDKFRFHEKCEKKMKPHLHVTQQSETKLSENSFTRDSYFSRSTLLIQWELQGIQRTSPVYMSEKYALEIDSAPLAASSVNTSTCL